MLRVSILVLVDAALRRFDLFGMIKDGEVSILVLVDAALRLGWSVASSRRVGCVSILVLVDAALRRPFVG